MLKRKLEYELKEEGIKQVKLSYCWIRLFELNQLAFAVWSYFSIYHVLLLCQVHSSWKNRIWQFEDRSRESRVKAKIMKRGKGKLKIMKVAAVKKLLGRILSKSSKTITSCSNQYFFGLKSIFFMHFLPLNSRLRVLCSLATNLRELHIHRFMRIPIEFRTLRIIANHCWQIEFLYLSKCLIDRRTFYLLSRFSKLKRFVLEDDGMNRIEFGIENTALSLFYQSCPDLVEVNLSSTRFKNIESFDTICPCISLV